MTLADRLKRAGYRTAAFVGAAVLDVRYGLDRGFDAYDDKYAEARGAPDFYVVERRAPDVLRPALEWILDARAAPGPWFAWVHLFDPHAPYRAPHEYTTERSPYDAEVAYTDRALSDALEQLRAGGQLDRTLIIVTADHGESLGEHGETTHGLFAYESTLRVPLIVTGPRIDASVLTRPAAHVDVMPTVLDLLGLEGEPGLDGRSIVDASDTAAIYFEALDASLTRDWAPLTGIVFRNWKYIDLPVPELYDLAADPAEERNLAAREPQRLRDMENGTNLRLIFRTYVNRPDDSPQNWCSNDPLISSVYGVSRFASSGVDSPPMRSRSAPSSCGPSYRPLPFWSRKLYSA